jgi:hypothetical protein
MRSSGGTDGQATGRRQRCLRSDGGRRFERAGCGLERAPRTARRLKLKGGAADVGFVVTDDEFAEAQDALAEGPLGLEKPTGRAYKTPEQVRRARAKALKKSSHARWSVLVEESTVVEGRHIVLRMEKGDPTVITEHWLLLGTEARGLRDALDAALRDAEK